MFLDEICIRIASGKGGDGMVHFRREKYVPRGGPDGGDGGKGGDVIFEASEGLSSLSKFRYQKMYKAESGRPGGGSNKTGASGQDLILSVPCGTLIYDQESERLLGDLQEAGQRLKLCSGGRGGRGNARFATARNQAPRMAERGEPGIELALRLELRLIADVGIIGAPNAGKSTLLAALTRAKPKIAPYPFTTLHPNLGLAQLDPEIQLILADIPGLIEGAHQGAGLGSKFLRHIQRTRVLIHLIDGCSADPMADFSQVNAELALFDPELAQKPQVVAVNKIDLPQAAEAWPKLRARFKRLGLETLAISALAHTGLQPLLWAAYRELENLAPEARQEQLPVYRVEQDPRSFDITRDPDGAWRVQGQAIERAAAMTYWDNDEAVHRFQRILEQLGVEQALRQAGAVDNETVRIGEYELEWQD